MPDAKLDVPGTAALDDEIVTLFVHSTLLDGLDLPIEEVSQCNILIISCGMLLEVFFIQNFFSCLCLIRQFFDFPKSLQLLI